MSPAQQALERVSRAIAGMIIGIIPELEPFSFHGWMAAQIPRKIDNTIKTMALAYDYDTMEPMLLFNEVFASQQTLKEIRAIIAHEIDHLVHRHPNRRGSRDPERFNIAADMAVNHDINEDLNEHPTSREYVELPPWVIQPAQGVTDCTAENFYSIVNEQQQDNGEKRWQYRMSSGGSQDVDGDTDQTQDSHDQWASFDDLPGDQFDAQIEDLVRNAADSAGSVPGYIDGIIKGFMKPKISWKHVLRSFVGQNTKVSTYQTWSRPNRRMPYFVSPEGYLFPSAPGKRWLRSGTVGVVIDTSGSVPDEDLAQAMTEVDIISQTHAVWVIECDAEVQDMYLYDSRKYKVEGKNMKGRGGTKMNPGLDAFNKFKDVEMIVVITDGWLFDSPLPQCKPELWVISSNGSDSHVQDRRYVKMPAD